MIVVNLGNLVHTYGSQTVLDGVSWEIQAGQKVGLVGPNGAGKSTLLRIIAGELAPDSGSVFRHKEARIGYLAQEPALDPSRTAWEEVLSASKELVCAEAELRRIEARLADPDLLDDQAATERTLSALARAQAEFERLDGYRYSSRARETLRTLGVEESAFDLPVSVLSGGQKKMVGLAKLMLSDANFLLLDEPTNNLDLPSCEVLENALDEFEGTVLVISHDRYFLDRVVERIVELEEGELTEYPGDYTYYASQKARPEHESGRK